MSAQIEQEALSAKEAGIEGVPCFIFDGKFRGIGRAGAGISPQAIERLANEKQDAAE